MANKLSKIKAKDFIAWRLESLKAWMLYKLPDPNAFLSAFPPSSFQALHFWLFRSLYTYYPIRESYLDTWYPLHKYTSGISFVNGLVAILNKYENSISYIIIFHLLTAWHTLCSYIKTTR
jgi:hypothetical protein